MKTNAKHQLKIVEPTPQDDLDAAIAAEANLSEQLTAAQADFARKFPGDIRVLTLNMQQWQPEKIEYDNAAAHIDQLKRDRAAAAAVLAKARLRVAQLGTEKEKRGVLARAIAAAAATAKTLSTAETAIARASEMVRAAQTKHDGATAAAQSAREQHARNAEEAARTGEPLAAGSIREARSAEADALDDLDAAKAALAKIRETSSRAADAHRDSVETVARCADDVIMTTALHDLLDRGRALTAELIQVRMALRYLDRTELELDVDREVVAEFLSLRELPGRSGDVHYSNLDDDSAAAPWIKTREALKRDAGAPLPTI